MNYISQNHSKHLLMAHIIFVCKYRKHLLVDFGDQIKALFIEISEEHNIHIIEMEIDKDHIHFLLQYSPTQSVLEVVRWFKKISTYRIWRQNNNQQLLVKQF